MIGPNIAATSDLARQTDIPVIASGGVSSLEHISELVKEKNNFRRHLRKSLI